MNGKRKLHKATGPAFAPGEQWVGSGNSVVTILSVRKYPSASADSCNTSNFAVTYTWIEHGECLKHEKDAWNFQVRYTHIADMNLKVKK